MKLRVYVLVVDSVYDYEGNRHVFLFDSISKAEHAMRKGVECFLRENDIDESGWVCEYDGDFNVCYQEPGDYAANHIEWEIRGHEVDFDDMYIVTKDFVNCYVEDTQQWAGTHEAAVFTKAQADALVKSERDRYNLHGVHGACAFKLTNIQSQLVEEE